MQIVFVFLQAVETFIKELIERKNKETRGTKGNGEPSGQRENTLQGANSGKKGGKMSEVRGPAAFPHVFLYCQKYFSRLITFTDCQKGKRHLHVIRSVKTFGTVCA